MSEQPMDTIDSATPQKSTQQPAQLEPMKNPQIDQSVKLNIQSEKKISVNESANKENEELTEVILKLEEQLKLFTKSQRFVEAEELKNKVKELRLQVVIRKSREIEHRHAEELERLINGQSTEIELFHQTWETKVNEFKQNVETAEKEMLIKHEKDLVALENDLKESLPVFVRTSPQISNMKKMIETLAKQKEFVQADKLRLQLASLEDEELRKSEDQKEKKLGYILLQLSTKQKSEFNGLKKRISAAYSELVKAKESEYQKLLTKLHNLRKGLETAQQLEFCKFELAYKNFVPGEKLQFKARQRRESSAATAPRTRTSHHSSMNVSIVEASKTTSPIPVIDPYKRSTTPVKKDFHIRGHSSSNTRANRQNNLIPINNGRFGSAQRERKGEVSVK